MKAFYWETKQGWKIYNKLQKAAADESLDDEMRFAAEALLADGHPSCMGYTLKMNDYYMEHFIYIITM